MTFEEYGRERDSRWRSYLLKVSTYVSCLVLAAELVIMFLFVKWGELTEYGQYALYRIIFPSSLNFAGLALAFLYSKKKGVSDWCKNLTAALEIVVVCSTMAIFHNYFNFILVAVGVPFFVCTFFADKKIFNIVFISSICVFFISSYTLFSDPYGGTFIYKFTTLGCYAVYLLISFIIGTMIIDSQQRQNAFVSENYRRQNEMMQKMKIDALTQLCNRAAYDDHIASVIEKYREKKFTEAPVIAMIDIDFFKKVNDTYGHACGDVVLIKLADIISRVMGSSRNAFRYGGEEFILFFDDMMVDSVFRVIKSIQDQFEAERFDFAPEKCITLSAGISVCQPDMDGEKWFKAVDEALYQSKNTGRNKITVR